jgi:hypothetical protein
MFSQEKRVTAWNYSPYCFYFLSLLSLHGVGALTVEMVLSVPNGSDGAGMILIVKEGTSTPLNCNDALVVIVCNSRKRDIEKH